MILDFEKYQTSDRESLIDCVHQYLSLITSGVDGEIVIFDKGTKRHHRFITGDLRAAARFLLEGSESRSDVYVRANIQAHGGGAKSDTVSALTVLTLDFDIAGPSHAQADLPISKGDLDVLLAAAEAPSPTIVLGTGGGLLAVWVLETPFLIATSQQREQAIALSRQFQGRLTQVGKTLGWRLDSTGDLVRACRVPGTRNWKEAYGPGGAEVSVHSAPGERVSLESVRLFAAKFEEQAKKSRKAPPKARRTPADGQGHRAGPKPRWAGIYAGCEVLRRWADTSDGLPEPHWYALANIVGYCEDGEKIFQDLSRADVRYSEDETSAKLTQAVSSSKPRLCASISEQGGDCSGCPFLGAIKSPISLGQETEAIVSLARQWIYIIELDGFLDVFEIEGDPS